MIGLIYHRQLRTYAGSQAPAWELALTKILDLMAALQRLPENKTLHESKRTLFFIYCPSSVNVLLD